jgi:hypothetical protein
MRAIACTLLVFALAACGGGDTPGGSTYAGGAAPPADYVDDPPLWNDYLVGMGETINLAESVEINFVSVDEDTRCPTGPECLVAGNARITVKALTPRGSFVVTLNTNPSLPSSALFDYYGITLRKLEPNPTVDAQGQVIPIPANEYVATVFVVKEAQPP